MLSLTEFTFDFLVESLAEYTKEYTRLIKDKGDEIEISSCREMINSILAELNHRRKPAEGSRP
jgi:hypothetical protein